MRFVEIALLAAPLVVFVIWRIMLPVGRPPQVWVFGLLASVLIMGGLLLALRHEDAAPPDAYYIPSRVENGLVIPGHAEEAPPEHAKAIPPAPKIGQ